MEENIENEENMEMEESMNVEENMDIEESMENEENIDMEESIDDEEKENINVEETIQKAESTYKEERVHTEESIHIDEITMNKLVLHKVGNKSQDEGIRIAKKLFNLTEELQDILMSYFISGFKLDDIYEFNHEHDLSMNEIYTYCSYIFEDVDANFYEQSVNILKHLYDKSNHVKIKGGELYVAYFQDCVIDDEMVDAIGIFKAENKDTYLKLKLDEEEEWTLDFEEGTDISKLDKGCLIFNKEKDTGYRVVSIDLKSADAKYWKDEFLTITQVQNERFQTQAYMDMCKEFGKKAFKEEDKNESVDFLNRSKDYFEHYKEFEEQEFKEIVFEDNMEKMDFFEAHKQDFQEKLGIEDTAEDGFFISKPVVKKAKRGFKNKITLDTEIEIKILSSQAQAEGFVERGYDDEKEMKYYKIYFNNEK